MYLSVGVHVCMCVCFLHRLEDLQCHGICPSVHFTGVVFDGQEVELWFDSLPIPNISTHRDALLGGMDGAFIADEWTVEVR